MRIVDRQISEERHPLRLDLPVGDRAGATEMMRRQRIEQVGPMCSYVRHAMFADRGEIAFLVLVIGGGDNLVVAIEQSDAAATMVTVAVGVPRTGIGAAEPEQHVLRLRQRDVPADQFDREERQVDVVEEIEFDARDVEHDWLVASA